MSQPITHAPGTNGVPSVELPHVELAEDGLPPFSPEALASLRELDWLDAEYNAGRLRPYIGEYVVSANHTILAHHWRYGTALEDAERKAAELGIHPERLMVYPVGGIE